MSHLQKHPWLMLVTGIFGISLSSIFVKYAQAPSALTAAFRLLWTVALLAPAMLASPQNRAEVRKIPGKLAALSALSGLFLAAHFVLWFESLNHTSVASSTAIVCTEVIWVALGFCLILRGRLSWKAAAAIGVTMVGSVCIAFADSGRSGGLYGDILSLLAAIAVAGYTLIGRVVRKSVSTTVYTFLVYTVCAAVLTAVCLVQGISFAGFGLRPVIVGLLLAVFSTLLGHSIFSWCLKYFSPAFVSASKLCEPVVAGILAGFLFGELPGGLQLAGGALILGGVLFYSHLERKNPHKT